MEDEWTGGACQALAIFMHAYTATYKNRPTRTQALLREAQEVDFRLRGREAEGLLVAVDGLLGLAPHAPDMRAVRDGLHVLAVEL